MGFLQDAPPIQHIPYKAGKDPIWKAFQETGIVVIKNFLSPTEVTQFNDEIDPSMQKTPVGGSFENEVTAEGLGKNTKRFTDVISVSPFFRNRILEDEMIHDLCKAIFSPTSSLLFGGSTPGETSATGAYWINTAQIIEIGPGNKAQFLHRDHDQWPVFAHTGPEGPLASVNFFFALGEFSEEIGATRVVPGSHRWPDQMDNSAEHTVPAVMEPGDVAVWGSRLIHGGGANVTKDRYRRGLALSMQANYLTPEDAYAFTVPRHIVTSMTPRGQAMIQWRSQFPRGSNGIWAAHMRDVATFLGLDN